MSRIRSTHPGVWTDERFVSVGAFARLLFMGIWNECDDYGSFEWSPLKLKMRLLPADAVDASALMAELEEAGSIQRYEIEGKSYGAVRNFCQYQRPKKPTHVHPQTAEVEAWVNTDARSTRDGSEGEGKELPTGGGKSRQRKEEGGIGRPVPAKARTGGKRAQGTRLPLDFVVPDDWKAWAATERNWDNSTVETEAASFVDHWHAKAGKDGVRLDWLATWRNWVRGSRRPNGVGNGQAKRPPTAEELRRSIAYAEDHDDPERAAEYRRQLAALTERPKSTGPPGQSIGAIVQRAGLSH